jgi:hypothetical protein
MNHTQLSHSDVISLTFTLSLTLSLPGILFRPLSIQSSNDFKSNGGTALAEALLVLTGLNVINLRSGIFLCICPTVMREGNAKDENDGAVRG